jgi:hypothetical protein
MSFLSGRELHMEAGCGIRAMMVFVGGLVAAGAVQAGGARALSDEELSQVSGYGLTAPTLQMLSRQDQSSSYASAEGALAAIGTLTSEGTSALERQTARQQMQAATVGLQETLRLAQTLAAATPLVTPIAGFTMPALGATMPAMGLPGLGLPLPPVTSGGDGKKH